MRCVHALDAGLLSGWLQRGNDVTVFWKEAFATYIGKSIVRVMGPYRKAPNL
jgi:hypothetical protein